MTDAAVIGVVRGQILTERSGQVWPGFDQEADFELAVERCRLVLTQADVSFAAGPTNWKAGNMPPSDMVTLQ